MDSCAYSGYVYTAAAAVMVAHKDIPQVAYALLAV